MHKIDFKFNKKFRGSFDALSKMGAKYQNRERFTPLHDAGKPLWEFKEHDHRLYCWRRFAAEYVDVVLLDGWIKDKKGKTSAEDSRIESAQLLLSEFLAELACVSALDDLLEGEKKNGK